MTDEWVVVNGVSILKIHANVRDVKKRRNLIDGKWVLTTRLGGEIATFDSLEALDRWWDGVLGVKRPAKIQQPSKDKPSGNVRRQSEPAARRRHTAPLRENWTQPLLRAMRRSEQPPGLRQDDTVVLNGVRISSAHVASLPEALAARQPNGGWYVQGPQGEIIAEFTCQHSLNAWLKKARLFNRVAQSHESASMSVEVERQASPKAVSQPNPKARLNAISKPGKRKRNANISYSNLRTNISYTLTSVTGYTAKKTQMADGRWHLITSDGRHNWRFSSEASLMNFWLSLRATLASRSSKTVSNTTSAAKPSETKSRQSKPPRSKGEKKTPFSGTHSDYLKPWSSKYNMPEYDLE